MPFLGHAAFFTPPHRCDFEMKKYKYIFLILMLISVPGERPGCIVNGKGYYMNSMARIIFIAIPHPRDYS